MKLVIVSLFLLISTNAFACPDLSGEFFSSEYRGNYIISQTGCEFIQFDYDGLIIEANTDGVERLELDYDVVVEEGSILANIKVFTNNLFNGDKLITNQKVVTTYTSDGKVEVDNSSIETFLDDQNNIINVTFDANGTSQSVDIRVK